MQPWQAILIGAAGTWVVAILAIWGEKIRLWLFKPTLDIGQGEFSGTMARHAGDRSARYYKLPVRNPKRFPAAHEVQLVLTRIEKSGAHGPEIIFDEIMPLWWDRQELEAPSETHNRYGPLCVPLFHTGRRLAGVYASKLACSFPARTSGRHNALGDVADSSIEADSRSTRLKIDWNGQWRSDKIGLSTNCRVTVA